MQDDQPVTKIEGEPVPTMKRAKRTYTLTLKGFPMSTWSVPRVIQSGDEKVPFIALFSKATQEKIAEMAKPFCPPEPLEGPLRVTMSFHRDPPLYTSKKKKQWWLGNPEISSPVKVIIHALEGLMWKKDSQIIEIHARKVYSRGDCKTDIVVKELGQEEL